MANYIAAAIHPRTGAIEQATFLDGHFGARRYGVRFADGSIWRAEDVQVPNKDPFFQAEGVDM